MSGQSGRVGSTRKSYKPWNKNVAKGSQTFIALERDGKSIRVGYLNDDGSLGRSILIQEANLTQSELLLKWVLARLTPEKILEAVTKTHGIDRVDDILDDLFGEQEEVSV